MIWYTSVVRAILQIWPKTEIRLQFGWSGAGFVKMACFRPEPDPKSGTALDTIYPSGDVEGVFQLNLTHVYTDPSSQVAYSQDPHN